MAVLQPVFTALFTRKQQRIQQTSIVIRSKKMVRSRSRDSLSDPQQLRQSVLSEPPRDRSDVDAIEEWQIWIDSAVRDLAESRRF